MCFFKIVEKFLPEKSLLHDNDKEFFRQYFNKHWKNVQELSSASQLFTDDKEFHLHLYDKLWENITNKENRLWSFLAFYGVAIGIVLGTTDSNTLSFETGLCLIIITYWAAEITFSAEWWSVRNRLMVQGIERRVYQATRGIIPSVYKAPNYRSEHLHSITLLVLAAFGLIIFSVSMGLFKPEDNLKSLFELLKLLMLYITLVVTLIRFADMRESKINKYHGISKILSEEEPPEVRKTINQNSQENYCNEQIKNQRRKDMIELSWRPPILILYIIATTIMLIIYNKKVVNLEDIFYQILVQIVILLLYIYQWKRYLENNDKYYGFSLDFWDKGFKNDVPDDQAKCNFRFINFILGVLLLIFVIVLFLQYLIF